MMPHDTLARLMISLSKMQEWGRQYIAPFHFPAYFIGFWKSAK